ncbi:MAG: DNA adenine methylase [Anaerolineae bacterium]|nr:DNA adenine methylase [Anaerolineae bacterium]
MLNSPIKWVGGKSRLRKQIVALLPPHSCYVEPFCGAAWVLFAKPPSKVEVINDLDGDLINFFRVVKHQPEAFIQAFDFELVSRAEFERLAALDVTQLSELERAHRFYYLIMAGWGGELNYPRFQTSISDGGHGNRLIGALKGLRKRIEPIHARLSTVIIENLDWRECIARYDRPGVVMYVDPPYPGNGVNYVHNMRSWNDHWELAEILHKADCQWILSSYDNPEVREVFRDCTITAVQSSSGMRQKKHDTRRVVVDEVLITNFAPGEQIAPEAASLQQAELL